MNNFNKQGFCNLRDFIKTIEKIGVVLPKVHDMQIVFDFYDQEKNGKIDYKKLSQEIFDPSIKNKRVYGPQDKLSDGLLNKNLMNMLAGKKYILIHKINYI